MVVIGENHQNRFLWNRDQRYYRTYGDLVKPFRKMFRCFNCLWQVVISTGQARFLADKLLTWLFWGVILRKNIQGKSMAYNIYLIKDYKNKSISIQHGRRCPKRLLLWALGAVFACVWLWSNWSHHFASVVGERAGDPLPVPSWTILTPGAPVKEAPMPGAILTGATEKGAEAAFETIADATVPAQTKAETTDKNVPSYWQTVTVKSGDSLARIFSREGLSPASLHNIMSLGKEVAGLKKLFPGQILHFNIQNNKLISLEYEIDFARKLKITGEDDQYTVELIDIELETRVKHARVTIRDNLFDSGQEAGLSDNLIMRLAAIYGWDIDFALDIRKGDSFVLVYEEQYKQNGVRVKEGPIVAAEFINRGRAIKAVRYVRTDGQVDYYSDTGSAMRKAFLRTPVDFTRISSHFNLRRKHPILNRIRAHKGIDYAAPTGTPVRATGDGTVTLARVDGGYGKTVMLRHGDKYTTVYAHLRRYGKGIRTGKRVQQGQVIGYVGRSGLATGPHLHYEFRIHGVHHNPLTVKLPGAKSINPDELSRFRETIAPILAKLGRLGNKSVLAARQEGNPRKDG